MQTKKNNAQAKGKGKTRHLRLSQRRLDEDPTTGTLDTPAKSLRDCRELEVSESRANKSHCASRLSPAPQRPHCPSEMSHWDRGGGRKGAMQVQ